MAKKYTGRTARGDCEVQWLISIPQASEMLGFVKRNEVNSLIRMGLIQAYRAPRRTDPEGFLASESTRPLWTTENDILAYLKRKHD